LGERPSSVGNISTVSPVRSSASRRSTRRYDLGSIDLEQKTLQPLDNPFGPKLLPMS
jgi:hypothetical protein